MGEDRMSKDNKAEEVKVVPKVEKPLKVVHVAQSSLYKVVRDGGGHVPPQLNGMWTDSSLANQAITTYKTNKAA
jgi:hypothetical protein